ncbi:MAG: hypothetical protein ABI700_12185, partial [Chloroflexota bacterium]
MLVLIGKLFPGGDPAELIYLDKTSPPANMRIALAKATGSHIPSFWHRLRRHPWTEQRAFRAVQLESLILGLFTAYQPGDSSSGSSVYGISLRLPSVTVRRLRLSCFFQPAHIR